MERRLRELALPSPQIAVTEHETLAADPLQLREDDTLPIVAVVLLQDVTDLARVREEKAAPAKETDLNDVAVSAAAVLQKAQRIAPHGGEKAERRGEVRTGRLADGSGRFRLDQRGRHATSARAI